MEVIQLQDSTLISLSDPANRISKKCWILIHRVALGTPRVLIIRTVCLFFSYGFRMVHVIPCYVIQLKASGEVLHISVERLIPER